MTRKRIVVVVQTAASARAREALRAAVGLCLRGDRVSVRGAVDRSDAQVSRALATLARLGHDVDLDAPVAAALRDADAVEVWT